MKLVAPLLAREAIPDLALRHIRLVAEPTDAVLAEQWGRDARPERNAGIVLAWPADAAEAGAATSALASHSEGVFPVDEVVHWDELDDDADAFVLVYRVKRRRELSFDAFAAHYRERHAPLARAHHPGIARYVQNYRSQDEEKTPFDAVSELWFANVDDARTRFYRDEASVAIIAEDVARFIDLRGGGAFAARPR